MTKKRRSYCKGLLCRECDRKHKSYLSGVYMCGMCAVETKRGFVTIDEFVKCEDEHSKQKMKQINDSFKVGPTTEKAYLHIDIDKVMNV